MWKKKRPKESNWLSQLSISAVVPEQWELQIVHSQCLKLSLGLSILQKSMATFLYRKYISFAGFAQKLSICSKADDEMLLVGVLPRYIFLQKWCWSNTAVTRVNLYQDSDYIISQNFCISFRCCCCYHFWKKKLWLAPSVLLKIDGARLGTCISNASKAAKKYNLSWSSYSKITTHKPCQH